MHKLMIIRDDFVNRLCRNMREQLCSVLVDYFLEELKGQV